MLEGIEYWCWRFWLQRGSRGRSEFRRRWTTGWLRWLELCWIFDRTCTWRPAGPLRSWFFWMGDEVLFEVDKPRWVPFNLVESIVGEECLQIAGSYQHFRVGLYLNQSALLHSCSDCPKRMFWVFMPLFKRNHEIGGWNCLIISVKTQEASFVSYRTVLKLARGVVYGSSSAQGVHWFIAACNEPREEKEKG